MGQIGEVAQLRRYLPAQAHVLQNQPYDAAIVVGSYTFPFSDRSVRQPVFIFAHVPEPAVRGVEKGN